MIMNICYLLIIKWYAKEAKLILFLLLCHTWLSTEGSFLFGFSLHHVHKKATCQVMFEVRVVEMYKFSGIGDRPKKLSNWSNYVRENLTHTQTHWFVTTYKLRLEKLVAVTRLHRRSRLVCIQNTLFSLWLKRSGKSDEVLSTNLHFMPPKRRSRV